MTTTCKVEGCNRPKNAGLMCSMHYHRWKKHGDPGPAGRINSLKTDPLDVRMQRIGWAVQDNGCWLWNGYTAPNGYGMVSIAPYRRGYAHRAAWTVANGPIPDGMQVCHRCDNPPCVNPAHLFLGTVIDNMRDMSTKGRAPRGERAGGVKLTEAQVRDIRASTKSGSDLAREYGVSRSCISTIVTGQRWKHLLAS